MKFSKGKGLLAVLALVVALTPVTGNLKVSASDTDGLSGIATILAEATPNKKSGIRTNVGIADVTTNENERQIKSVRLAAFILREDKPDIDELIETARLKAWENKAIVTVEEDQFVYMRSEPNTEGSILGIMPHGAAATVIEEHGDWSYVNSGMIDGYVSNDYLAFGEEALEIAEEVCGYVAYVESYQANVRTGPSLKEEVIDTVGEGMYFEVIEQDNGWVKIKYTKDQEAYMSESVVDVFLATGVAVYIDEVFETEEEEEPEDVEETNDSDDSYYESSSSSDTSYTDSYEDYSDTSSSSNASTDYVEEEPAVEAVTGSESVFKITAYCPCSICCGAYANGQTASGTTCTPGRTIAVDPSIIPMGTTVYIDGVPYVAEDTGVSGYKIDIYMPSHVEALNWGVRYCTVTW